LAGWPATLHLILAHGIGRLVGQGAGAQSDYACAGQADTFAVAEVSRQIFQSPDYLRAGLEQIKSLFMNIQNPHREGSDRCEDPSVDCRLDSLNANMVRGYCRGRGHGTNFPLDQKSGRQ